MSFENNETMNVIKNFIDFFNQKQRDTFIESQFLFLLSLEILFFFFVLVHVLKSCER